MFRSFRSFSATLLLLVSTPLLVAQDQPPNPQPKPTLIGPPKTAASTQQTFVSYWTLEPGWNTELEMRNNMAQGKLTITPVLRTATGQEIPLIPISLSPEQVISLNLQDAVGQVDPGIANHMGSFGSVVFRFAGHSAANMFAASVVRREGHPIDFHFDGEDSGPDSNSGGIQGIWWLPADTSTGYLMLSNPSNKAVKAKLVLSQSSGGTHQFPIVVGPGQTERMSIRDLLGPSSSGGMGGVRVSFPHAGALSATQIVFDEVTGLAAIMRMFDREPDDKVSSHVLRAPMMALTQPDPALAFPKGTVLIPRILLWNAGSSPLPMSATVDWRKEKASGTFQLPALKLLPEQARIIDLSELQRNTQIPASAMWSTITLNYTGRTADLVAVAIAYDKGSRYGLQTPFSEGTSRLFKGSMWHVDGTHNTLITTGNGGSEPTTAQVTLFYNDGQGKYRIEKPLSPGQQLWLDVGELIRNQVPDSDGHTMPPDTMTGSYELRDIDHPLVGLLYEGKLVIDKTFGHAS